MVTLDDCSVINHKLTHLRTDRPLIRVLIMLLIGTMTPVESIAQNTTTKIDTFHIYANKCGISFQIYKKQWMGRSYTFAHTNLNKQDSIVLIDQSTKYIRVYNSRNVLWFESGSNEYGELFGDIIFYFPNGTIERIEHRDKEIAIESCPDSMLLDFESPMCNGTWKYYRKDGTLKKEKKYSHQSDDCSWNKSGFFCQTTRFRRNGKVRSTQEREFRYAKD